MSNKKIHINFFILGFLILIYSIISVFIFKSSNFYTSFVIGSFLVFDFWDYKINNYSIITYFLNKKHRDAFAIFIIISTLFCFIIDYIYGVKIAQMWDWVNYKPIHYIQMYIFMNGAFILSMYELYRLIKTFLKKFIRDKSYFKLYNQKNIYKMYLVFGISFLFLPLYSIITSDYTYIEYIMLLPFLSMVLISDSITYFLKGKPISNNIFKGNILIVTSLFTTSIIGAIYTESINFFGQEWLYIKMPFDFIKIYNIPIAVFIGWFPLVIGSIAVVNMIIRLDNFFDKET